MAQKKKRATVRKRKTTTHRKARKASKSARGKAVKRAVAKPAPRSARVKKIARKRARPVKSPSTPAVEAVVVDVIEEPVPGVITVTEFEETKVREASKDTEEAEENGPAPPEPEKQ